MCICSEWDGGCKWCAIHLKFTCVRRSLSLVYSDNVQTNMILIQLALPPLADDVRCHIIFSPQAKLLYMKCPQTKMHKSAFF